MFVAFTGCEAVSDFMGFGGGGGSSDTYQPDLSQNDWTGSSFEELAVVAGTDTLVVPSAHAGKTLLYLVSNSGTTERTFQLPATALQTNIHGSSVQAAGGGESSGTPPASRAIRGIPGQFDLTAPLLVHEPSEGSTIGSRSVVHAASYAVGDTDTLNTIDGPLSVEIVRARSQGEWSVYVWLPTSGAPGFTSAELDLLADSFVNAGNDDIFDIVTGTFGLPWGSHAVSNVIPASSRGIHILLYDIEGDGVPGPGEERTVGYFNPNDSFLISSNGNSNERLMFYLDAALYADDGEFWPSEVVSTLAHEFQHMIQFYQRSVRYPTAASYDTWLNELASLVAEDLTARYIGVNGPRGVDPADGSAGAVGLTGGRMPEYNLAAANTSLVTWGAGEVLDDYAVSYAFGAFLVRSYGADFFTQLLTQNPNGAGGTESRNAVVDAAAAVIGQTLPFSEHLRRWGVAMLVSNDTQVPPMYRLNTGTWIGGVTPGENVGSLNAYNYRNIVGGSAYDGPLIYRAAAGATMVSREANTFVYAGEVPPGGTSLQFAIPGDVTVSVLVWD